MLIINLCGEVFGEYTAPDSRRKVPGNDQSTFLMYLPSIRPSYRILRCIKHAAKQYFNRDLILHTYSTRIARVCVKCLRRRACTVVFYY